MIKTIELVLIDAIGFAPQCDDFLFALAALFFASRFPLHVPKYILQETQSC